MHTVLQPKHIWHGHGQKSPNPAPPSLQKAIKASRDVNLKSGFRHQSRSVTLLAHFAELQTASGLAGRQQALSDPWEWVPCVKQII